MIFEALLGLLALSSDRAAHPSVVRAVPLHEAPAAVAGSARAARCEAPDEAAHDAAATDDRIRAAGCRARRGQLVDALKLGRSALEDALASEDTARTITARTQVEALLVRMPHVRFVSYDGAPSPIEVRFDGKRVPEAGLGVERWSVDPGAHEVVVTQQIRRQRVEKRLTLDVREGTTVVIPVSGTPDTLALR